mgnify:CR=1 FL=1
MVGEMFDPRKEFGKAVTIAAKANPNIVVFSADSGKSSGFGEFMQIFPERYFECGIMEQGVVGMSAGISTAGKIPVFCAIAPFVTARPYEMLRNDVGYMGQNVKIVGRNCGITYSDLGSTHCGLDDFALMRMIPGMTILAPQDPVELRQAVFAMLEHKGPVYMRIGGPKIMQIFEEKPFVIGKGSILRNGTDVTLFSTGSATKDVLEAANILYGKGISCLVIGMPTVYPLDQELVKWAANKTGRVMTVEEHYVEGGFGSIVTEVLSETPNLIVRRVGLPKEYTVTCGDYDRLLDYYQLNSCGIVRQVEQFLTDHMTA